LRSPHYCRSFAVGAAVNAVCLRPDRDEFISGDQNGLVKFWDLNDTKGPVHTVQPSSPDSHFGALLGGGGSTTNHAHPYRYSEGMVPIQAVDIAEDSRTLVAVSNHGTVFVWDPSGNSGPRRSSTDHPSTDDATESTSNEPVPPPSAAAAAAVAVTPDAHGLVPITKFRAHAEKPGTYCLHAKIAPDCRHLVTTASSGVAKLWDTTTWQLTQTLQQAPSPPPPTSAPNATSNSSNNSASSHLSNTSSTSSKWVWDAAFCADSSYLVTASSDHVARLWNLRTGDVVRQYHGHQSAVTCVALNDSSI
jgi:target of rapamycin complex subunit LST8